MLRCGASHAEDPQSGSSLKLVAEHRAKSAPGICFTWRRIALISFRGLYDGDEPDTDLVILLPHWLALDATAVDRHPDPEFSRDIRLTAILARPGGTEA